jgi:pantetheine-phosphate adenylyltransferase
MTRIAIYPGSFDPVTNGHIDIVERASQMFDKIIVAILYNPNKKSLFTMEERMEMLKERRMEIPGLEFDTFAGFLGDYA